MRKTPDVNKLVEQLVAVGEKITKANEYMLKKQNAFAKLCVKYQGESKMHEILPYEVFVKFTYTNKEDVERAKFLAGVIDKHNSYAYNPDAMIMLYNAKMSVYAKYPCKDDVKGYYRALCDFDALRANVQDSATIDLIQNIMWDYINKAQDIFGTIEKKRAEIAELRVKLDNIKTEINNANNSPVDKLFSQVPVLGEFIDQCAEKQYEFLVKQNELLAEKWKKYYELDRKACDYHNNRYLLSDEEKATWAETCKKLFDESRAIKPKHAVMSKDRIRKDVEDWKRNERAFLASRIQTEFGDIASVTLHLGADGNVNGFINGTLKSAKIETIWAGGYNIQRLHTRFLVHEK